MAKSKNAAKGKDTKKEKAEEVTVVPELRDEAGNLFKLKGKDFPKTKEGRIAWCDYQIARWQEKKLAVEKRDDPAAKKLAKLEKLKKQLSDLEKEIEEEASE